MICASSIPGLNQILPWYVLEGTYSFGNICNNTETSVTTIIDEEEDVTTQDVEIE